MHIAFDASAPVPQMAPFAFDQVIIAGGDEDVSASDMFEWISPLLAGIPGGHWMSCQMEFGAGGDVTAQYRDGGSATVLSMSFHADAPVTRELVQQLPEAPSMTVILLNDFSSQAVTLLDGIARWLSIHEVDEHRLVPVLRLLGGFQTLLSPA